MAKEKKLPTPQYLIDMGAKNEDISFENRVTLAWLCEYTKVKSSTLKGIMVRNKLVKRYYFNPLVDKVFFHRADAPKIKEFLKTMPTERGRLARTEPGSPPEIPFTEKYKGKVVKFQCLVGISAEEFKFFKRSLREKKMTLQMYLTNVITAELEHLKKQTRTR